jgi:hypothetical protein
MEHLYDDHGQRTAYCQQIQELLDEKVADIFHTFPEANPRELQNEINHSAFEQSLLRLI